MVFSSQQCRRSMGKLPPAPGEWELGPSLLAGIDKMKGKRTSSWNNRSNGSGREGRGNENEEQRLLKQTETIRALFPELWDLNFPLSKQHFWEQEWAMFWETVSTWCTSETKSYEVRSCIQLSLSRRSCIPPDLCSLCSLSNKSGHRAHRQHMQYLYLFGLVVLTTFSCWSCQCCNWPFQCKMSTF